MADFGDNDPLSVAVRGRGNLYALDTATQPGQGALDVVPHGTPLMSSNLVNQAIDARSQLEAQRQQLIGRLGSTGSRREAFAIGEALRGIDSQQRQLNFEDNQRRMEAREARSIAHQEAELAADALKIDREHAIDEQGSQLLTGLGRLDALRRRGNINDEQYDAGLLDLGQNFGLGLRHPTAGKMYSHFIEESDKRNQFNLRRTTSEVTKLAARYGIEPQFGEDGLPSIEATKQAALSTPRGRNEAFKQMNDEMMEKYGVPTGVGSLFNPIESHTEADKGKSINIPFLDKEGKISQMKVPRQLFEQMKADFQDRYFSLSQPETTSTATAPAGLQAGATRNVGGVNYTWNGSRWEQQ